MAYVSVDVSIDEFDTEEICQELIERMNAVGRRKPTDKQIEEVRKSLALLIKKFHFDVTDHKGIANTTLDDKMKLDFLGSVWDKYNCYQLEERLK